MTKKSVVIAFITVSLLGSCLTFIGKNGKRRPHLFPVKDKADASNIDTSYFLKQPFNRADYDSKTGHKNGKKMVQPIEGKDVLSLTDTKEPYYIYFWNPNCRGSISKLHKLDSLSRTSKNILIVSLRAEYQRIDALLKKTNFSHYPYYTIEAHRYTDLLALRQIWFTRDACEACYKEYKDDVTAADYLLIQNGAVRTVMFNDSANMLRR